MSTVDINPGTTYKKRIQNSYHLSIFNLLIFSLYNKRIFSSGTTGTYCVGIYLYLSSFCVTQVYYYFSFFVFGYFTEFRRWPSVVRLVQFFWKRCECFGNGIVEEQKQQQQPKIRIYTSTTYFRVYLWDDIIPVRFIFLFLLYFFL